MLSQEAAALLALPEQEPAASAPRAPRLPAGVFPGVDEERLLDKAQRDMREFDRLTAKKHRPSVPFWVLAALLLGPCCGKLVHPARAAFARCVRVGRAGLRRHGDWKRGV